MKILIILISIITFKTMSYSQEYENQSINYRVVAVKSDDENITSESNEIKLYLPLQIYMPTAFSPNGDGLNDDFGPVGEGIEKYKLVIYNRWGEPLFSTENVAVKWDGSYKGKPVAFGNYNYELLAYGKEFGQVHKTGHVTVVN